MARAGRWGRAAAAEASAVSLNSLAEAEEAAATTAVAAAEAKMKPATFSRARVEGAAAPTCCHHKTATGSPPRTPPSLRR